MGNNEQNTLQEQINIINAIEDNPDRFNNKHWYKVTLSIPVKGDDAQRYPAKELNNVVRKLVNGKRSYGKVNNRDWFNRHFAGGFYKMIIEQTSPDDYFTVHYLLQCYSDRGNLDTDVQKGLAARFKLIAPTGTATIEPGQRINITNRSEVLSNLLSVTYMQSTLHLDSEPVQALGRDFRLFCLNTLKEEIRTFGDLYKIIYPSPWH